MLKVSKARKPVIFSVIGTPAEVVSHRRHEPTRLDMNEQSVAPMRNPRFLEHEFQNNSISSDFPLTRVLFVRITNGRTC